MHRTEDNEQLHLHMHEETFQVINLSIGMLQYSIYHTMSIVKYETQVVILYRTLIRGVAICPAEGDKASFIILLCTLVQFLSRCPY